MFHFGWFIGKGYSPHNWNQQWSGNIGSDWMEPDLYMDLARALERACFDCLILEDGSFIADAFQGSPEWYLRNAFSVPKSDPLPLVPLLGYVTTADIADTSTGPPVRRSACTFNRARRFSSIAPSPAAIRCLLILSLPGVLTAISQADLLSSSATKSDVSRAERYTPSAGGHATGLLGHRHSA